MAGWSHPGMISASSRAGCPFLVPLGWIDIWHKRLWDKITLANAMHLLKASAYINHTSAAPTSCVSANVRRGGGGT